MKHEKISSHHLERKAILYVRQSSAHQVLHNREIGALPPSAKAEAGKRVGQAKGRVAQAFTARQAEL